MKNLPDHGYLRAAFPNYDDLYSECFVKELARKFGLEGRENMLFAELNSAAWRYQAVQEFSTPLVEQQRKLPKEAHPEHSSGCPVDAFPNGRKSRGFAIWCLVYSLNSTYREMTGDLRRNTSDDDKGEFKGPAIEFIQDCLEQIGEEKLNCRFDGFMLEMHPH